jgi:hypothetical protein
MEVAYLLISRGGLPHRNLATWAAELKQRLSDLNLGDRSPAAVSRLINITNEAALIEAHRGNYKPAADICCSQLANLHRHPEAHTFPIARCALNPWLNLGRLASLSGGASDACRMFALFRDSTGIANLAGVALNLSELNARLRTEKGYPDFCTHVYVGNSLRALVRNCAWSDLVAFTESCASVDPSMRPILDEARVVASIYLGSPAEALEVAKAHRNAQRLYVRLTFQLRELECLARLERRAENELWTELEAGVSVIMAERERAVGPLALGLHLAEVALQQNERATARRVAAQCLGGAESLGDELYTHAALRVLSSCSDEPDASSFGEMAERLAAQSGYEAICDGRHHRTLEPPDLADTACEALA